MSLIHLAAVGAALIVLGTVLVCAAHIPGLRVLVGAEPTGPVPTPQDEADVAEALHAIADDLTASAELVRQRGLRMDDLAVRAAMRLVARGLDEAEADDGRAER